MDERFGKHGGIFQIFRRFLRLSANFLNSVSQAFISSYFLFMNNGNDVFFIGMVR